MEPDEVEYIAEIQMITITPNFSGPILHFISGNIGPFRAGNTLRVPLWLAVYLRQQQRCFISAPDWMNVDTLEDTFNEEKTSKNFTKMPSEHYIVEAKLLLRYAAEDIPRADYIRTIIKDIWDMRMSKLRTSVDTLIKLSGTHATLNNLTIMEINSVRPLLPQTLDHLLKIKKAHLSADIRSQNISLSFNFSTDS